MIVAKNEVEAVIYFWLHSTVWLCVKIEKRASSSLGIAKPDQKLGNTYGIFPTISSEKVVWEKKRPIGHWAAKTKIEQDTSESNRESA